MNHSKNTITLQWGVCPILLLGLILMPFQWQVLATVGPLSMRPSHLFCLSIIGFTTLNILRNRVNIDSQPLTALGSFNVAYIAYLGVMAISVLTVSHGEFFSHWCRHAFLFTTYLMLAIHVSKLSGPVLARTVHLGVLLGTIAFILYAAISLNSVGRSLPKEVMHAVTTGDRDVLVRTHVAILNASADGITKQRNDAFITSSFKNQLASGFVVFLLLGAAFSTKNAPLHSRLLKLIALTLVVAIVVLLMSRSNMIVIGMCLSFMGAYRASKLQAFRTVQVQAIAGAAILLLVAIVFLMNPDQGGMVNLTIDNLMRLGDDPRFAHYNRVLSQVTANPFAGHGFGQQASDGYRVHNFILGGFFEAGIVGLVAAIIVSFTLGSTTLTAMIRSWRIDSIHLLPVLPLFRSMFCGDGGRLSLPEWIALGFFAALISRRHIKQRPQRRYSMHDDIPSTMPYIERELQEA